MDPLTGAIVAAVLWFVIGMGIAPVGVYLIVAGLVGIPFSKKDNGGRFIGAIILGDLAYTAVFIYSLIQVILQVVHAFQVG